MITENGRVLFRGVGPGNNMEAFPLTYRQCHVRMSPPEMEAIYTEGTDVWCLGKTLERCVIGRLQSMSDELVLFVNRCGVLYRPSRPLVYSLMDVGVALSDDE